MNRDTGVIEHVGRHMTDPALLKRITVRPEVFGGKPIIRDMRISVELILSLLAQGVTQESILEDYPDGWNRTGSCRSNPDGAMATG